MRSLSSPSGKPSPAQRFAFVALWLLIVLKLLLAAIILPPWQNPDETAHLAVARALAKYPAIELTKRFDLDVQREILASMATHGWWTAYDEPVPDPLPTRFEEVPQHLFHSSYTPALYYILASRFCQLVGAQSLLAQYYSLRALSLVITLGTFALIMRAAAVWFNRRVALMAGVVAVSLPQFALIGIAVSPDPLVFFLSAVVWWQAGHLVSAKAIALPAIAMIAATVLAVLSKQIAAPLVIQTALLLAIGFSAFASTHGARFIWRWAGIGLAIAALTVIIAIVADVQLFQRAQALFDRLQHADRNVMPSIRTFLWPETKGDTVLGFGYFRSFTSFVFSSGYLAAGWLRFWAAGWLYLLVAIITLTGVGRAVAAMVRDDDQRLRKHIAVAFLLVLVQVAALYCTRLYLPDSGAQGRYLFGALPPFVALVAVGLMWWREAGAKQLALCLAAALIALDLTAWATVVIPAYAAIGG